MELLVHGHGGVPLLVFPTSQGRFYEYEDRGMVAAVQHKYEAGQLQAFCVDSVDSESWYNRQAHPSWRVRRHLQYESYVLEEVVPLIRHLNPSGDIVAHGCSFGGFHAVAFALRRPDVFRGIVSLSGAFDIRSFLNGYHDEDVYFVNPPEFLPNLQDDWSLSRFRSFRAFVLGTSEWDICLAANRHFSGLLDAKGLPHDLDVWGAGFPHDWPLWQAMVRKYF